MALKARGIWTCAANELEMPVVQVEMWPGRTEGEKETPIHEVAKTNWGMRGEQTSKANP